MPLRKESRKTSWGIVSYQAFLVPSGNITHAVTEMGFAQHDHLLPCKFDPCHMDDREKQAYLAVLFTAAVHAVQARKTNLQPVHRWTETSTIRAFCHTTKHSLAAS